MKITIYELLGMVKDGKAPKKIKYHEDTYDYEDNDYFGTNRGYFFDRYNVSGMLNNEVEILEEEKKIPEKLTDILRVDDLIPPVDENMYKIWTQTIKNHNKINDIIDYLKSKGE